MSSSSRYQNKEYIPKLLWLNLNWTLQEVHYQVFLLYAYMLEIEEGEENAKYHKYY
jgi:hypothetical protein